MPPDPFDLDATIAGAIFDFAGYLAIQPDMSPAIDLPATIMAWAAKRQLSLVNADPETWLQARRPSSCSGSPTPYKNA